MCIKTKSAPRLHEVIVCHKNVFRLGQTVLFKTRAPCRRNTHLCMSFLATWCNCCLDVFVIITPCKRNDNVSMHNNCCFSEADVSHVQQRVAPKSETSGLIKCTLEHIGIVGKTSKTTKIWEQAWTNSIMPWRPPRTPACDYHTFLAFWLWLGVAVICYLQCDNWLSSTGDLLVTLTFLWGGVLSSLLRGPRVLHWSGVLLSWRSPWVIYVLEEFFV